MRRLSFWLSLLLIFILPWEDSVTLGSIGSLTRLIGLGVAGLWLFTILSEGRFRKPHLFHILAFLFFSWNVLSVFWTLNLSRTLMRTNTYIQMFILIMIFWEMYQKQSDILLGLQAYVFGAYVGTGSTIINYIVGQSAVVYEGRYSASGVNAVDLALILLLGLPIAWYLFTLPRQNKKKFGFMKFLNFAYIPLAIFAIVLTGSRTSLFAIIPFLIYMFGSNRIACLPRVMILAVLLVSVLVLIPYLPSSVLERLSTVSTSVESADLGGRVNLWIEARTVLTEHPVLGSGSGTLVPIIGSASHNTFISIFAETGIVGFSLFLFIFIIALFQILLMQKEHLGLWLAVLSTLVIGLFSLSWEFRKPTWLILSFIIIHGNFIQNQFHSLEKASGFSPNSKRQCSEDGSDGN